MGAEGESVSLWAWIGLGTAALSINRNTFVIDSANIFAILGLRALYLLLANLIGEWPYRHCGVAAVLAFTAVKLGLEPWLHIPVWLSLLVIVGSITSAIVASIRANRQSRPASG